MCTLSLWYHFYGPLLTLSAGRDHAGVFEETLWWAAYPYLPLRAVPVSLRFHQNLRKSKICLSTYRKRMQNPDECRWVMNAAFFDQLWETMHTSSTRTFEINYWRLKINCNHLVYQLKDVVMLGEWAGKGEDLCSRVHLINKLKQVQNRENTRNTKCRNIQTQETPNIDWQNTRETQGLYMHGGNKLNKVTTWGD